MFKLNNNMSVINGHVHMYGVICPKTIERENVSKLMNAFWAQSIYRLQYADRLLGSDLRDDSFTY